MVEVLHNTKASYIIDFQFQNILIRSEHALLALCTFANAYSKS